MYRGDYSDCILINKMIGRQPNMINIKGPTTEYVIVTTFLIKVYELITSSNYPILSKYDENKKVYKIIKCTFQGSKIVYVWTVNRSVYRLTTQRRSHICLNKTMLGEFTASGLL